MTMPRPPKDPVLARLKTPAQWNAYLLNTYGLPQESRSDLEKGESLFGDPRAGTSITLEEIAGSRNVASELDLLQKDTYDRETAADKSIVLSPDWARYFGVMCVVIDALIAEEKKEDAKAALLEDCRIGTARKKASPDLPADLGTPEELRQRWRRGEVDVCPVPPTNRQQHVIEIRAHLIPPYEPEEDDGEPDKGSWEGLKWQRH